MVYYTEYYSSLEERSPADRQQQVKNIPTNSLDLDLQSDRLHCNTNTTRSLTLIDDYNPYYPDPDFVFDPYWDLQTYSQHHLHFYNNFHKLLTDIQLASYETDRNLNPAHTKALVDPWQSKWTATSLATLDEPMQASNLGLKHMRRMLYFPLDFGELTLDGLVDTGALSSAIPEADLRKIRLLSPQSIIKEGPASNFQILVANGQLETPKGTVQLKFGIGDIDFHEIFIVMKKLTSPLIGLSFLQRNMLDMRQGVLNFPFFSSFLQLKTADNKYINVMEPICATGGYSYSPNDRHMVSMYSQLYDDTNVTGILQPSNDLAEDGDITFCAALVTLTQGQGTIHVKNFTDQSYTIKRGSHFADFSVLTPEQMKYGKPINPVTTWHLLQKNPENAAYYASSLIKSPKTDEDSENY